MSFLDIVGWMYVNRQDTPLPLLPGEALERKGHREDLLMEDLTPALHFSEESLIRMAGRAMDELDISWVSVAVSAPGEMELPDWIDDSLGGWVLFIESERFAEGMSRLAELMGYDGE